MNCNQIYNVNKLILMRKFSFLSCEGDGCIGIYSCIFAIYIGISPVYWFPWIDAFFIDGLKSIFYFIIIIVPIFNIISASKFSFPGGNIVFLLVILFFLLSIPGMLIGDKNASLYKLQNTLQIILFVHACGFLINKNNIYSVLKLAINIFSIFCIIAIIFMILNPRYVSPLNSGLVIFETGFGGSRTSWSPAISLFIPWLYSSNFFPLVVSCLYCLVMITNQVFVAGRTGIIAAIVPFFIWGVITKKTKIFLFTIFCLSLYVLYVINNREKFRIIKGGFATRADLNELSTGRWEQYVAAIGAISESPFFGHGSGEVLFEGKRWLIHNVILKAAAEGGIPYAIVILCIFSIVFFRGIRSADVSNKLYFSAFLTICAGIIASMFEPGFMFGAFNNSCFWWLCFSICVAKVNFKGNN